MAASEVNTAKLAEGNKLYAEAEKCLKTSLFKWSPDLDSAAPTFDKAGLAYRNAKALDKALDAYERAAEVYQRNNSPFTAGKSLEQAAKICKEMGKLEQSAGILERASSCYHESGYPDTAGQVLARAAKLVQEHSPGKAAQYYLSTADLHESEEKFRDAASAVRYAVSMYARTKDFDNLLGALYKLKNLYETTNQYRFLYEAAAVEVVVHLHRGDITAATDSFNTAALGMHGFPNSETAPLLEAMLVAYREADMEAFARCCEDSLFKSMDNELAKLARDLRARVDLGPSQEGVGSSEMAGATPLLAQVSPLSPEPSTSAGPDEPVVNYDDIN